MHSQIYEFRDASGVLYRRRHRRQSVVDSKKHDKRRHDDPKQSFDQEKQKQDKTEFPVTMH